MGESVFHVSVPSMLEGILDGISAEGFFLAITQNRLALGNGHCTTNEGQGKRERQGSDAHFERRTRGNLRMVKGWQTRDGPAAAAGRGSINIQNWRNEWRNEWRNDGEKMETRSGGARVAEKRSALFFKKLISPVKRMNGCRPADVCGRTIWTERMRKSDSIVCSP